MIRKMVSIQEAAQFMGVAAQTLRRWEPEGKLLPDERTPGGRRRYNLARLRPEQFQAAPQARKTIAYARVSSDDQKDDLEHFGAELVFAICQAKDVQVLIINKGVDTTFEEDLANDVLEIITVFSARLYDSRSSKNQKLLDSVRQAVQAQSC